MFRAQRGSSRFWCTRQRNHEQRGCATRRALRRHRRHAARRGDLERAVVRRAVDLPSPRSGNQRIYGLQRLLIRKGDPRTGVRRGGRRGKNSDRRRRGAGLVGDIVPIFLSELTRRITEHPRDAAESLRDLPSQGTQLQWGLGIGLAPNDPAREQRRCRAQVEEHEGEKMVAAKTRHPVHRLRTRRREGYLFSPQTTWYLEPSGLRDPRQVPSGGALGATHAASGDHEYLTISNEQTAALGLGVR